MVQSGDSLILKFSPSINRAAVAKAASLSTAASTSMVGSGDQSRDCSATHMLYGGYPTSTTLQDTAFCLLKFLRPARVIVHQTYFLLFHSNRISRVLMDGHPHIWMHLPMLHCVNIVKSRPNQLPEVRRLRPPNPRYGESKHTAWDASNAPIESKNPYISTKTS